MNFHSDHHVGPGLVAPPGERLRPQGVLGAAGTNRITETHAQLMG